ncbi:transcriptional regulator GutM [Alkalicoccus saliphilus]|uniref:Transcriptional regulator n=1 Tax=Alkalicoccus saliphilus TaxID=200989 RepID=A0A2T4U279_9BACI|nr:transcriptional regulator GutM [Alkalicoccus saliphilus]PTL37512.1 hypothetical protein C6Y45_16070 [Alkalicoccus saliphilus]
MAYWGLFFIVFAGIWVLQFYMAHYQMKNYYQTLRKMSRKEEGFLGVGIHKRKFGKGVVAILVTNNEGVIVDAQRMSGVTVFSRFENFDDVVGIHLNDVYKVVEEPKLVEAVEMAIQKIDDQRFHTLQKAGG